LSGAAGVNIINTGEHQNLLGNLGSDTTSSSWGWDKPDSTRTTLSLAFNWNGVDISDLRSPISSSHWDKVDFGIYERSFNSNLHFFGDFDSKADMTLSVSYSYNCLESSSLTSLGLLLH